MDEERVREAIESLYIGAGIQKQFSGKINERVAEVFGEMLNEIRQCSTAFAWVPRPTGGKATVTWVARNFTRSTVERLRDRNGLACERGVIYKWDRELQMAGAGL
jgi:hypothetical protein